MKGTAVFRRRKQKQKIIFLGEFELKTGSLVIGDSASAMRYGHEKIYTNVRSRFPLHENDLYILDDTYFGFPVVGLYGRYEIWEDKWTLVGVDVDFGYWDSRWPPKHIKKAKNFTELFDMH